MQVPSQERIALALALVGCGMLVAMAATHGPAIAPADAAAHVGQDVSVTGYVRDLTVRDGTARFVLAAGGHGVPVQLEGPPPDPGALVTVEGRLSSFGGTIRLHSDTHTVAQAPDAAAISLAELARDPTPWTDRPLRLIAVPEGDRLVQGDHAVHVTGLPAPLEGTALSGVHAVEGILRYEAACMCYVLQAHASVPWTP